jgi:hypothetical protein
MVNIHSKHIVVLDEYDHQTEHFLFSHIGAYRPYFTAPHLQQAQGYSSLRFYRSDWPGVNALNWKWT